eukprot:2991161-Rhodomonas_salina.1
MAAEEGTRRRQALGRPPIYRLVLLRRSAVTSQGGWSRHTPWSSARSNAKVERGRWRKRGREGEKGGKGRELSLIHI